MSSGLHRAGYFLAAAFREYAPGAWAVARRRLAARLPERLEDVPSDVLERVAYYNRLTAPVDDLPPVRLGDMSISTTDRSGKMYYIDLMRDAQGFGPEFRIAPLFGDVTHVPDAPSLVKSRPIAGDVAQSVLLPLDALRHFQFPKDSRCWADKRPSAVWRGMLNGQAPRIAAVRLYADSPAHDIGQVHEAEGLAPPKGWLSIAQQLEHRYVLSLEGNDVATNLKWIMASNSVALAPKLEYETWYMEGRLEPGVHFVQIRADLSDLDERIAWCEANPQEMERIVRNAQTWVRQFRDPARERLIAALVLQKYAEFTGGLGLTSSPVRLFT
ncbi:3-hydroxybutyryl-CoA dehydrogenase [Roseobacter sp. AzwK-3b]|uniref:glycosyl transferase family 90 n=1 Tax=Roseobacter sp. AzwK-3b TaxID=351016 RepID=UPI0001569CFA|nr:glycosyl transferase family 90 [Roseobacter sp. AzwK-3b]EDM72466.1 3-hydroxybutyryl-CoA dehydrogenase [Roseobacter sp. AzwK-3b]